MGRGRFDWYRASVLFKKKIFLQVFILKTEYRYFHHGTGASMKAQLDSDGGGRWDPCCRLAHGSDIILFLKRMLSLKLEDRAFASALVLQSPETRFSPLCRGVVERLK